MKKALIYLGMSVIILGMIISYDVVKCDGQVLMRYFFEHGKEDLTEKYDLDDYTYSEKKEEKKAEQRQEQLKSENRDTELQDCGRGYEFYYIRLTEEEQEAYRKMYDAFINITTDEEIPTLEDESMNLVADAIRNDHPELFYVDEMGYTHYTRGGQIQRTVINATYSESKAAIESKRKLIEEAADEIIESIPEDADDYTKIKMVYEAIINNTTYDLSAPDNQSIDSVLIYQRSVCAGYARTTQYLLNKLDIPTTIINGYDYESGQSHAWNLCYADGEYYHLDTTWGEASYSSNGVRENQNYEGIRYDYFMITSDEICRTHALQDGVDVPYCTATEDNYYVREGLLIDEYSTERIRDAFERAYAEGWNEISFKCANLEIYDEARQSLIKSGDVFNLYHDQKSTISYVENEEQRIICFWL